MLTLPELYDANLRRGFRVITVDYCSYGMPWRKRTTLWHTVLNLEHMSHRKCSRDHERQVLRGSAPSGVAWTLVAQPYPKGFCADLTAAAYLSFG